jgi:tetratricopeptide (TPR) repeat protein/NAD-dependent dihydropyrimidine dehydrogenase PreA subunit
MVTLTPQRSCDGRARSPGPSRIELPVVAVHNAGIRHSRTSRWRAAVLIAIHLLILAHVAHWVISGRTLSPVEPSEAMYTLNNGYLNAGFIFFGLAILSTLVFGRYFCGWGCHLVAYQDLCGWLLKKIGLKPKPFRARILVFAPLALAIYMFVWPTVHRIVVGYEAPPVSNHLMTSDFWQTFPGPGIAILTFAVCGFVIVYFLGNKGFCTYACPYGGFFGLADKFAPGRIRVTDDCEHCGHCTAVCTSNVRVHEEVALYGMVVDPGCMKCMDCVSVCPNDALYFGFGTRPGTKRVGSESGGSGTKSKARMEVRKHEGPPPRAPSPVAKERKYDFALWEELLMVCIGLAALLAFRGLYTRIPLLLAMAMAGITAYLTLKFIRMFRDANVRLQNVQLTRGRRWTRWGWGFACGVVALLVLAVHSGAVQLQVRRGHTLFRETGISDEVWLPGNSWWEGASPLQRAQVDAAIGRLSAADRWGLAATPAALQDLLWLYLARGDTAAAEAAINQLLDIREDAATCRGLASLHRKLSRWPEAERNYLRALELDPHFEQARLELAAMYLQNGRPEDAVRQYRQGIETSEDGTRFVIELSRTLAASGKLDEAALALEQYLAQSESPAVLAEIGLLKLRRGDPAGIGLLRQAMALDPTLTDARYNLAVALLGASSEEGAAENQARILEAMSHLREVIAARPQFADAHYNLAVAMFMSGRPDEAVPHARESIRLAPSDAQARAFLQMLESRK